MSVTGMSHVGDMEVDKQGAYCAQADILQGRIMTLVRVSENLKFLGHKQCLLELLIGIHGHLRTSDKRLFLHFQDCVDPSYYGTFM